MNLPAWAKNPMRRKAKDIKVKDFVDDQTKRDMVKEALKNVPGREVNAPRTVTSGGELVEYLKSARSVREVAEQFKYSTLSSAYQALQKQVRVGLVAPLGRGLYIATGEAKSFNIADLPESELQAKGYDAYKAKIAQEKEYLEAKRAEEMRRISEEHAAHPYSPNYGSRPTAIRASASDRMRAILDFISKGQIRTTTEIARTFGYSSSDTALPMIRKLVRLGLLVELAPKHGLALRFKRTDKTANFDLIDESNRKNSKVSGLAAERARMVLEYIATPKTAQEVANQFNYANTGNSARFMEQLVLNGYATELPKQQGHSRVFQAVPGASQTFKASKQRKSPVILRPRQPLTKRGPAMLEYLKTPRSTREIATEFSYAKTYSAQRAMDTLLALGTITELPRGKNGTRIFQAQASLAPSGPVTTSPESPQTDAVTGAAFTGTDEPLAPKLEDIRTDHPMVEEPKPGPVAVTPPSAPLADAMLAAAKDWAWENNLANSERETIKSFIEYIKNQQEQAHE